MAKKLDARRQTLKNEFTKARGYWNELWDSILDLTPEYFEAYMNYSSVPWRKGVLSPKVKEFIYIAIDAATTHLHEQGLGVHMGNAIRYGATQEELLEVLELTSVLGIHTLTMGVPCLFDELRAAGRGAEIDPKPLTPRQEQLKQQFQTNRGYWNDLWNGILQISPDFFEAYMHLSSVPWTHGVLEPKVKEFIYIAIDASTTHLYELGTRVHIRNALKYGATVEEIMEVFQLTSVLGIHTITLGVPTMIAEFAKAKKAKKAPKAKAKPKANKKAAKKKAKRK
jgi:alkylhydroperoxidase/carboxymuconolactone decarboxylase family protein YurZ